MSEIKTWRRFHTEAGNARCFCESCFADSELDENVEVLTRGDDDLVFCEVCGTTLA